MDTKDPHSIITVSNLWAEDLFKWFFERISEDGGDGAGAIVCKNYEEVADWFTRWYQSTYEKPWSKYFPKTILDDMVYFHNGEECYIFTNRSDYSMPFHDYIFKVIGDCYFSQDLCTNKRRIIAHGH